MNVGDYALIPKRVHHFAWSKTGTIIQVHGIGPFQVIPVDDWNLLSGGKIPSGNRKCKLSKPPPCSVTRLVIESDLKPVKA
jgi:hypothetical protein